MAANHRFLGFESLGEATPFVDRILENIDYSRVFDGFEKGEIRALARYLQCYRVPAGAELIGEGEVGDFMLLLIDGAMEITKKDASGLPVQIGEASPGKTLGEMSVIDGEPRFASCVTVVESIVAVLRREQLLRLAGDRPPLGLKLVMQMGVLLNQRLRKISVEYIRCRNALRDAATAS